MPIPQTVDPESKPASSEPRADRSARPTCSELQAAAHRRSSAGRAATSGTRTARSYLDLLGGIATCALGHCHPEVTAAAKAQMDTLWHVSNVFYSEPQIALAEQLTALSGLAGARSSATRARRPTRRCIKLARKAQNDRGQPGALRVHLLRELASTAAPWPPSPPPASPSTRRASSRCPPGFVHVPYGDLEAVRKAVGPQTAAILVEPIQGEGGVRTAPDGLPEGAARAVRRARLLLLIDEVQTGHGPHRQDVRLPARGHPARRRSAWPRRSATACPSARWSAPRRRARRFARAPTARTFGGNLVAAAAAIATRPPGQRPARRSRPTLEKGEHVVARGRQMQARHPALVEGRARARAPPGLRAVVRARDRWSPAAGSAACSEPRRRETVRFAPPLHRHPRGAGRGARASSRSRVVARRPTPVAGSEPPRRRAR